MNDLEVKISCPLGHTCKRIVDGHIEQCAWYTDIEGINAKNERVTRHNCAIAWLPTLSIDHSESSKRTEAAIQSTRNQAIKLVQAVTDAKKLQSN